MFWNPRRAFLVQLALFATCLSACGGSDGAQADLTLTGTLDRPATLAPRQFESMPATTQTVSFSSGSGPQTHTYTGASLWHLLDQAGIQTNGAHNAALNKYVLATGSDGYKAVFSLGELNPDFGNRASLVAYAETLNSASLPLGSDGPFRVTSPGDVKGGRYVSNLVRLDVRDSASTVVSKGGGESTAFTVTGAIQRPGSFNLAALKALPALGTQAGGSTYRGISLWDFLNATVGLVTKPEVKNDSLGLYVVATGSDGYRAVFSVAELDPGFGNQPNLIAYEADGVPLTTTGFARLVVPNDGKAGRFVSNLISLEVFAAAP